MKNKPEPADSSLSETMAARIEIKELDDPVRQKEISGKRAGRRNRNQNREWCAARSYGPLATSEKKIEQAIRSTGTTIEAAATDTEGVLPDLPASASLEQASIKNPRDRENA